MAIQDLVSDFVRKLNLFIMEKDFSENDIQVLKAHIDATALRVENAERRAQELLGRVLNGRVSNSTAIYMRQNGYLRGVVSNDIEKVKVPPCETLEEECECVGYHFLSFNKPTEYIVISREEELIELDRTLTEVYIQVLDHDYRSYHGFSCFITLLDSSGPLYIIDAIKFRQTMSRLRLLRCGVYKLIHCRGCVHRLFKDFGRIGCYQNFTGHESERFVDWRIRPLNDVLISIMFEGMNEIVDNMECNMAYERYVPSNSTNSEFEEFIGKHELIESGQDCAIKKILQLRGYLASSSDEGLQFVMTDSQMLKLLRELPSTTEEFEETLKRLSPVARQHIGDFILALHGTVRRVSVMDLKAEAAPKEEAEEYEKDKYRSFSNMFK